MNEGHANFLDNLVSKLHMSDDENEAASAVQEQTPGARKEPAKDKSKVEPQKPDDQQEEHEEHDDEDTASDNWSECDSTNDDYHALERTISGRPSATHAELETQGGSNSKPTTEHAEDYFHFELSGPKVIAVGEVLNLGEIEPQGEDYKKDAIVSVTVASEVLTPLASPDEIELSSPSRTATRFNMT
jgi:hypothetical protein